MRSLGGALLLLAVVGVAGAESVAATSHPDLLASPHVTDKVALPTHAKTGYGIEGALEPQAFDAAVLDISLPDGRVLTAIRQHVSRDAAQDTATWTGRIDGSPGDRVILARRHGTVAGFLSNGGRTYEMVPGTSGRHVVFEVLPPPASIFDALRVPPELRHSWPKAGDSFVGSLSAAVCPVVHDLLVVYTQAAVANSRVPTLGSMIVAAVEAANASYRDSGVNVTLSLVGIEPVGVTEKAGMPDTLFVASNDADLAALRDHFGADMVLIIAENSDWCGYAYIMDNNTTQFAPFAFAAARSECLSSQALAHELGHVQGVAHDRETGGNPGAFPYAHGYRRCIADGSAFHDIMAYCCTNISSHCLSTFASPDIFYNGYRTGISYELDPVNSADAARTLNETGATVAGFRVSMVTPPLGPGSLTATVVSASRIDLAWIDRAANEAGFKIERSTDGVNYVETARLGVDVTSYLDSTVDATTAWSYRVAAYNSAGLSGYSNVATATHAPPADDSHEHSRSGDGGGAMDAPLAGLAAFWAALRFVLARRRTAA